MIVAQNLPTACEACGATIIQGLSTAQCPQCLWKVCFEDASAEHDSTDEPWLVLGDCELLDEIARGGMGVVYRARQRRLDRFVAVKLLRGGESASPNARRRFLAEARTTAQLHHPGIVTIHDAGDDAGVLWFSMDYLPGGPLVQPEGTLLPPAKAARFALQIAEAVQFAHDHGVLHRDIKPSNVLLGIDGQPRVADFGIAHILSTPSAGQSSVNQPHGSPGYAAPEQVFQGEITMRTDVYGLGALLYFLLTGRPPFQGSTADSVREQLRTHEPVRPRLQNPPVPHDLETICLHALEKDPASRYASARSMADDLERFLRDEPVHARPITWVDRAIRWCRRRPGSAVLVILAITLAAGLGGGTALYFHRQSELVRRTALVASARFLPVGQVDGARTRALASLREAWLIAPSNEIRNEVISWLGLPEMTFDRTLPAAEAMPPAAAAVSGFDARDVFTVEGGRDRFLHVRDAVSGELTNRLSGHDAPTGAVAFRNGGQEFASAAADGHVRLWHAARGVEVLHAYGTPRHRAPLWWSADDSRLFCPRADDDSVDVYSVDWTPAVRVMAPALEEPRTENLQTFAVSPDGRLAATVDEDETRIWDLDAARVLKIIPKKLGEWMSVEFAPDGRALWLCGFNSDLRRLEVDRSPDGSVALGALETFPFGRGALLAAISPDGERVALSQNTNGEWLLVTPPASLRRIPQIAPFRLTFDQAQPRVATSSLGSAEFTFWSLPNGVRGTSLQAGSPIEKLKFSPDGRSLWISTERDVQRWSLASMQPEFITPARGYRGLTFSSNGRFAASYEAGVVRLLHPHDLSEIARLTPPPAAGWLGNASLRFDAVGSRLAAHTALGTVIVWDLDALRTELRQLGMDWDEATR